MFGLDIPSSVFLLVPIEFSLAGDAEYHVADALDADLLDATETNDFKWMNKDAYRERGEFIYE